MELALAGGIEAFAIATSDRDFTYLAHRLRRRGLHVLGLGEPKAPECFRRACSAFQVLEGATADPIPAPCGVPPLDRQIRSMIARDSRGGRGMPIAELGRKMYVEHGTLISTRPERSWRAYLSARPALYQLDPRGPEAMVRFLPAGFA